MLRWFLWLKPRTTASACSDKLGRTEVRRGSTLDPRGTLDRALGTVRALLFVSGGESLLITSSATLVTSFWALLSTPCVRLERSGSSSCSVMTLGLCLSHQSYYCFLLISWCKSLHFLTLISQQMQPMHICFSCQGSGCVYQLLSVII